MATDRVCSSCGLRTLKLFSKQGRWRCTNEDCGDDFPFEADGGATGAGGTRSHGLAGVDLERLPSVIAIPLGEYAAEKDPLLGLWRICDTIELTLRLVVAVGIADVLRASKQVLPAKLRATLAEEIEEPTLGGWRAMACEIAKHVFEGAVVPELAHFVTGSLEPFLRGPGQAKDRTLENSLALVRNQLAHGGGVTRSVAAKLLVLHAPRFEEVMRAGVWLGDIELVTPRKDGLHAVLGGPHPGLRAFRPASDAVLLEVQRASQAGDAVVLVRGTSVLSLWPFTVYGLPASSNPDALPARGEVPQVYSRRGLVRLQLTPVGSLELAQSEASDEALRRFEALFRREETAPTTKWRVAGWEASLRRDSQKLVGRAAEIEALRKVIDETPAGVLWLTGPAGIGKSFLMARTACDLIDDAKAGEVVLPFRFKVGDGRCSQATFLEFAIERLRAATGVTVDGDEGRSSKQKPLDELGELLAQVKGRVVFLLDGLDEIAASDPEFASKVPLGLVGPNVVWMCAGRPERGLTETFSPGRCRHVFGGGVPRMSAPDIRDMLMRRLDFLARELARSDRDAGAQVENPFVAAVEKNAEGLPIYVEYVIGDVCTRRIQVLDERARLPASLAAYHEELLKRCQVGSLQMVLTPLVCLLAVAHEPLTELSLHALLVHWLRISDGPDGRALLRKALGAVQSMLRLEWTPSGEEGYSLFHHSLRDHMETSEISREAVATARRVLGDAVLAWEVMGKTAAAAYLFRHGVAHLLEHQRGDHACALLTTFGYLMARLETLGPHEARGVAGDLLRVEAAGCRAKEFEPWTRFLRERMHVIDRGGATTLLQAAVAEADASPVTQAAEAWLAGGHWRKPWLRRLGRPKEVVRTACLQTLEGHSGGANAVALHGRHAVSGSNDSTLKVWDLESGACLRTLAGHSAVVTAVALHGRRAVSASWDGTLKVWDLDSGACLRTLKGHSDRVTAAALYLDGRRMVSASWDETLKVWDLESGACLRTLKGHSGDVNAVALHPDGARAVSASWDGRLKVWDLESGACLRTLAAPPPPPTPLGDLEKLQEPVTAVALHSDGWRAVSAGWDRTLKVWDLESAACLRTLKGHSGDVNAVALHPDGSRAVSASDDETLKVWDLESGACLRTLEGHSGDVNAVALHPDGARAVSASDDGTLKVWDLESACLWTAEMHPRKMSALPYGLAVGAAPRSALRPDGQRAVWASWDNTLKVWDLESGACLRTLKGHSEYVTAVALHLDGRHAVSASWDNTLKVWDLESGACLRTLEGHSDYVSTVALHSDGRRAVSASGDRMLKVWDLESGACLRTLEGHSEYVDTVALHSDGRRAVSTSGDRLFKVRDGPGRAIDARGRLSASGDRMLKVWDLESGACLWTVEGHAGFAVVLHPDGRRAVVASSDKTLKVWDLASRACLRTLEGHSARVTAVVLHPDGERVVSASEDKTLKLWDLESGACLRTLEGHSGRVTAIALHSEGRAVSASEDKTLKLWDLESGGCIACWDADAAVRSAVSSAGLIVAGDQAGVFLLQLAGAIEATCR